MGTFGNSRSARRENVPCVKTVSRKNTLRQREIRWGTKKSGIAHLCDPARERKRIVFQSNKVVLLVNAQKMHELK